MRRFFVLLLAAVLAVSALPTGVQAASDTSDPISHGKMNTVTYVRWGKSELFPVLGMVGPNDEFDVYEYDEDWVMVLYDTWISQGNDVQSHSFFGYVKRSEIDCDPPLEGDSSPKADTGPGKRKGKKPKTQASPEPSASAVESATPSEEPSAEPTPTVEEQEEYDWIIRTDGTSTQTFDAGNGIMVSASFSLMAQKAGGTAPSSDPTFNHGMHTPYAATAYLNLVCKMSDAIGNWGLSDLMQGSGGWEINIKAPSSRFFLDTGSEDFALVNLSIPATSDAVIDPNVVADTGSGTISANFSGQVSGAMSIPVQLQRSGGGYRFVLKNMRPGGGDLTFPAVLEKTFADEDRWQKEAQKADQARKKAEEQRKKMEEEARKKAEDAAKESPAPAASEEPLAPLVTPEPLAPLVTPEPLAPLVTEEPLAPLVPATAPPEPVAPLVPQDGENVDNFPGGK